MEIIDTHLHIADCCISELDYSEGDLIDNMDKNKLSSIIIQPFPGVNDPIKTHKQISDLAKKYPGKIYGIISINPHCNEDIYIDKVKNIFNMGGFVGIKLHTLGHVISPLASDAQKVYKLAEELELPVMIHTGLTIFGEPALSLVPAKKHPNVNFILAHSGWSGHAAQAIIAALNADNIFLETSWTSIDEKKSIISIMGSDRVMLGSDTIANTSIEIMQYSNLCFEKKNLENIFSKVAKKVFKLG